MSEVNPTHIGDEIDLFEIITMLWQGKWIIVASVFIALAASYIYLMNKEVVYEYRLPYSLITAQNAGTFGDFLILSDVPFSLNEKSKTLSVTSINPNYEAVISSEAAIIGNKFTQTLIDEANLTIKLIEEDIPVQILNSETAAKRYFEAKSILQNMTDRTSAIEFQPVVKTEKTSKVIHVLIIFVVMGGVAGILFVFFLRMVAAYKKWQEDAK